MSSQDLVIMFGPPAVGKMSVGAELSRLTSLPLFHNHLPIEMVIRVFPFGSEPYNRLVPQYRKLMFEEVAASELPGLIFTFVWDLNDADDKAFIDGITATFSRARVCFVELCATLEERLSRNATPQRLSEKPSKRDVAFSQERLLAAEGEYRMNSAGDFFYPNCHFKIDNTHLPADEAARQIIKHFGLRRSTDAG
jgi:hypothetical protein